MHYILHCIVHTTNLLTTNLLTTNVLNTSLRSLRRRLGAAGASAHLHCAGGAGGASGAGRAGGAVAGYDAGGADASRGRTAFGGDALRRLLLLCAGVSK